VLRFCRLFLGERRGEFLPAANRKEHFFVRKAAHHYTKIKQLGFD